MMTRNSKIKSPTDIDVRYRSLLQKAVRRGNVNLVFTIGAFIENLGSKRKNWFASHAAIITFEECWPLGTELIFNQKFHSKLAALIKVARAVKARDAAGLGYLAFALSDGDRSVLNGTEEDKPIKILAKAVRRPDDFWKWADFQINTEYQRALVENASKYRNAGAFRDRSVLQAAAYLAISDNLPPISRLEPPEETFPFWIAFDKHTPEGRRVLFDIARDLHIPLPQLEWTSFYFEGAKTNGEVPSKWWDRQCRWHFLKIGLPPDEAHLLWEPAKTQLIEALEEESRNLHNQLYKWKLSNLERVEFLKKQVEFFNAHTHEAQKDQLDLFKRST
jgi:hypothetical protein